MGRPFQVRKWVFGKVLEKSVEVKVAGETIGGKKKDAASAFKRSSMKWSGNLHDNSGKSRRKTFQENSGNWLSTFSHVVEDEFCPRLVSETTKAARGLRSFYPRSPC